MAGHQKTGNCVGRSSSGMMSGVVYPNLPEADISDHQRDPAMSTPDFRSGSQSTRRTFLKSASVAALSVSTGPLILNASNKSGSKTSIIGKGEFRYEAHHGFGELPDDVVWGDTHGVAVDAEGLIYVKHRNRVPNVMDSIVVFDTKGKCVRSFGKKFHAGGHGIDIRKDDGEEFLYVSDVTHGVFAKMTLKGETVWQKGKPKDPGVYKDKMKFSPTNICFGPNGDFYVADGYGSDFIHQYDKNAKWIRTWGGTGSEKGQMKTPHGIWLDDRPGRKPSLVVADRANARLQYFTLDGKHIEFVNDVSFPADIDIQGEVMLVSDLHARITLFDKNNKVITHLGYDEAWTKQVLANKFKMRSTPGDWQPGRFIHPHDACFDKAGNIYVAEWVATGRVSFLRKVS